VSVREVSYALDFGASTKGQQENQAASGDRRLPEEKVGGSASGGAGG
jgi:hypothetical protein